MVKSVSQKYVPDLQNAAAVCEANYIKIQRIFPSRFDEDELSLELHNGRQQVGCADFIVLERFSYTTTIELRYQCQLLPENVFHIRIYDDALMAEVVLGEQGRQLNGVYPYPNNKMYQKDEKYQLNQMLSEALTHCMTHGMMAKSSLQA